MSSPLTGDCQREMESVPSRHSIHVPGSCNGSNNIRHDSKGTILTLNVLVTTIDAQWEEMGM